MTKRNYLLSETYITLLNLCYNAQTHLDIVEGYAELLIRRDKESPDKQDIFQTVQDAGEESRKLLNILRAMIITIYQTEMDSEEFPANLSELLKDMVKTQFPDVSSEPLSIRFHSEAESVFIKKSGVDLLRRALNFIVLYLNRVSDQDQAIDLSLSKTSDQAIITIRGEGIRQIEQTSRLELKTLLPDSFSIDDKVDLVRTIIEICQGEFEIDQEQNELRIILPLSMPLITRQGGVSK